MFATTAALAAPAIASTAGASAFAGATATAAAATTASALSAGTLLTYGALGTAAAGTALSAYGAHQQGEAGKESARYNARMMRLNEAAAEKKTLFDQMRAVRAGQRAMGTMRAHMGKSGVLLSEGAPLAVQASQAFENALNVSLIGVEGRTQASQYAQQAQSYAIQGSNVKRGAQYDVAGTLLSGFGAMAKMGAFDNVVRPTGTGTLFFNRWEV